ncbi:MAG: ABC transporter ATP-binding protein [Dehalococcoidia bacterium]
MSQVILQTKGLSRAFGGLIAVDKVDLAVESQKITAIIGPNGAGKTTLFNLITGVYAPTDGEISFQGNTISRALPKKARYHRDDGQIGGVMALVRHGMKKTLDPVILAVNSMVTSMQTRSCQVSPVQRTRMGIVRTFQHVHLFGNMTAIENIMTGQHSRSSYGFLEAAFLLPKKFREEERIRLNAMKYLNMLGLGQHAEENALNLPLGQQKLLAIARALATEPKLLLLDEPGAGLNRLEKRDLSDLIRRIREMGITVVLVEHDMPLVMGLAEKVVVLDTGKKIAEGTAAQVQKDKKVITAYLGDDEDDSNA